MVELSPLPPFVRKAEDGAWHIFVRAQPGAKKSEISGEQDGRLRIRLRAPAVENKANKELVAFMAELLKLRPSAISLESGETGRQKKLRIQSDKEPNWAALITDRP